MSALAARHLGPKDARVMALIGNGAQAEFQALAFKAICGIDDIRLFDTDSAATRKCLGNLADRGLKLTACRTAEEAMIGAGIITTVTADKRRAQIISDNMVGAGVHLNAVGGDCQGKTELAPEILRRASIFVEYPPQTRIEGEIQQLAPDHPVTEFWQVLAGQAPGRRNDREVTVFDSVGFAVEDFSALRYVHGKLESLPFFDRLDMIADPDDPRDLFGMLMRARARMED